MSSLQKEIIVMGGSDPSGGAGIQADLLTLSKLGISAKSVISAVTAQNEKKFWSYESVSAKNFSDQLRAVEASAKHPILKIGMMGHFQLLVLLKAWIQKTRPSFVILDPVFASSTGAKLLDSLGIQFLKTMLPWIDLITPNISEAEKLSGLRIHNFTGMKEAGEKILKNGAQQILLKGGHLKGNPCDLLITPEMNYHFPGRRLRPKNTHGTGCTLASAIAGFLSLGKDCVESIHLARKMVRQKITSHSLSLRG